MSLFACGTCGCHVREGSEGCPHCGEALPKATLPTSAVWVLGLVLSGCQLYQPMYGIAATDQFKEDTGCDTGSSEDTGDSEDTGCGTTTE